MILESRKISDQKRISVYCFTAEDKCDLDKLKEQLAVFTSLNQLSNILQAEIIRFDEYPESI